MFENGISDGQAMAGVTGLEPAASGVTGRRSNQLSYTPLGFSGGGSIYCARSRKSSKRAFIFATGMPPIRLISYPDGLNIPLIDTPNRRSADVRRRWGKLVGDDGIEPPTLSV